MKIGALEAQFKIELEPLYDADEAAALFSLSAGHVLGLSPVQLKMSREISPGFVELQKLLSILNDLTIGKPVQHILGVAHFYGLVFEVNEHTLIPRPETEELVDWIIQDHENNKTPDLTLLDIGTGSGCIPITLKKYLPGFEVTSIDVSVKASQMAIKNALANSVKVNFLEADIFSFKPEQKFDVIVSNPPYIRELEKAEMQVNVFDYEPHLALFVSDDNPLVFYKAIADLALKNLKSNGKLYLEINEYLAQETIDMLKDKGFNNMELKKDMQGKYRMIKAMISDDIA